LEINDIRKGKLTVDRCFLQCLSLFKLSIDNIYNDASFAKTKK